MWFDLARETKLPGTFNSGALSWTLAPELKFPGTFYSCAKKKFKLFFGLQPGNQAVSQPASKANPPAEAVRPT